MDWNRTRTVLDGALGTLVQNRLSPGAAPETLNITDPDAILAVHRAYTEAGADAVTTNTFGLNRIKYHGDYPLRDLIESGVRLAKQAGAKYTLLDVGPTGALLQPMGTLSMEDAYDAFCEQISIGVAAGADIVLIETMTDLLEAKAALLAAKAVCDKPVFVSMSFQENGRTFLGVDAASAAVTLSSLGVDAVGMNCSVGPAQLLPIVKTFLQYASVPVFVQPNAGLPKLRDGKTIYTVTPDAFAASVGEMLDLGVSIVGGCCGTTPDYIRALRRETTRRAQVSVRPFEGAAVCSATRCVALDGKTTVVGERINPTGKKKLQTALRNMDVEYVLREAIAQKDAGAQILDVNAGLPDLDEAAVLSRLVDELQSVTDLPLQIDSADPVALEQAVRRYRGKPIINSVNGKAESMAAVLPIVKKYGAAVVALTLDENGIAPTAEARFAVAEKIVRTAESIGIPRRDVIIDCLVLTVSTNPDSALETLRAVRMVKEKLGCKTALGVSNISFGLPARELVGRAFLSAALAAGLDLPILNPLSGANRETVDAFRVLRGEDTGAKDFIARYANAVPTPADGAAQTDVRTLVLNGQKGAVREAVLSLLQTTDPLSIINETLIPALDEVGERYERGVFFLPQLLGAAQAAKEGFDVLESAGASDTKRGEKVILATVQGDIHDIGKNIVKMLLQNYGYDVIDLGRDVPPETVAAETKAHGARLVGLCALMTTTVPSMERTVRMLRAQTDCKIMVGGAVVTQADADRIGADYYGKDAAEAARIAEKVFSQSESIGEV